MFSSSSSSSSSSVLKLTNTDLREQLPILVVQERKIMAQVLERIAEVDRRRLYLEWGHTSLFSYLTNELKYSEGSAHRRQNSARELNRTPELKESIQAGDLNLSQIAQTHQTIRLHEKSTKTRVEPKTRKLLFQSLKGKNGIETQKTLNAAFPGIEIPKPMQLKHKSDDTVEVTLRLPKELFAKIEEMKLLYAHIAPGADLLKILDLMATDAKRMRDPARHPARATKNLTQSFAAAEVVSKSVRRMVFQRDQSKCQHPTPNGVCGSRFQLEIDHIHPKFAGGSNEISNLRLLCRAHNQERYRLGR